MKKISVKTLCVVVVMVILSLPAFAQPTIRATGDDTWYFSMGGSDPYVTYRQSNRTNVRFGIGAEWDLFRSCQFDPRISIAETFADAQESIYGIVDDVVDLAPGLMTAWGLSQIQSNFPDQYNYIVTNLVEAKASFQVAMKSCRDLQNDVKAGRDPLDGWIRASKKQSWDMAANRGSNPVTVSAGIDEESGERGIVLRDGRRYGGRNPNGSLQPPIRTVEMTTEIGYAHLNNGADDPVRDPVRGSRNISRVFPTAASASSWMTSVVGEREVRTCNRNCNKLNTRVGQGLRLKHKEELDSVVAALQDALETPPQFLEPAALDDLSVPGMGILTTENTLRAIREAPTAERSILASRLASEIAIARVMEKALIARDLINAGAQDPYMTAADEAQKEIEYSKRRLNEELENVVFETELRKKVLTNTAFVASERGKLRDNSAKSGVIADPNRRERGMTEGAINAD